MVCLAAQEDFPAPSRALLRCATRAFTLIELLVVSAVIAILASLLLPALSGAKAVVQRESCKNRLKQWAFAMHTYADDHDGMSPRESAGTGETMLNTWADAASPASADVWYNALALELNTAGVSSYFSAPEEFYDNARIFHCPSVRFPPDATSPNVLLSIAMNSQLIKGTNSPTVSLNSIASAEPRRILFAEGRLVTDPEFVSGMATNDLGQPAIKANRVAVRHRRFSNVSLMDGSAHSVRGVPGDF